MKYFLIILSLFLLSCERYYETRTSVNGVVTSKEYEEAKDVMEYHYGWSMMRGEFCYHFGLNHHDEKFKTTVVTKGDTSVSNSKEIYNKYNENDTITMVEVRHFRENDKKLLSTSYYFSN